MEQDARQRGRSSLLAGATSRMREALGAWLDDDFDRAAASAPMAVELLGKAVLWSTNPSLLVPLENQQEAALVALSTEPKLDSPSLRTIGLKVALSRLTRVFGDLPVPGKRQTRLVDCRNGALHVGTLSQSGEQSAEVVARQVLTDSLTLCNFLLAKLEIDDDTFYDDKSELVVGLLRERRTELQHRVEHRLAQARERFAKWREHFENEEMWESSATELELAAADALPPHNFGLEMGGIGHECPACGYEGRLLGRVDVEGDADVEYEDGDYSYYGYWRLTFYPRLFACHVCKLMLFDTQELDAAHIDSADREVSEAQLGEGFSAAEWAEALYGVHD